MKPDLRPSRTVLGQALLTVLGACSGAVEPVPEREVTLRLSDLLGRASIDSPLSRIEGARGIEELGALARELVFSEDFEDFDPAAVRWPNTPIAAVCASDGGHVYRVSGRPVPRRTRLFEAAPNTHYLFERRVRAAGALAADFEVVELARPDQRALRESASVRAHWAPEPEPDGAWHEGSVAFFTRATTRALGVVLWETPRRVSRLGQEDVAGSRTVAFDDLRLWRLDPTPEQSIALVKAAHLAPDADPALGMRKHGQLPPLVQGGPLSSAEDNYAFRYALYAPPPTTLGFPLEIGPRAALRFSICLSTETRLGDAARFAISFRTADGEQPIFARTLRAEPSDWRWHDERVDLSALSGRQGELVLATTAEVGHPHPMWGHPLLEGPRRKPGPRLVVLIAVDTLRADRLSCYGYERETSPNLDALAADGVRFDQVVSNATWTCPSFASIFTGLVPSRHGVWVAGAMWARLPDRLTTLAEYFRAAGWATQAVAYKSPIYGSGYDQGFDVSFNTPARVGLADHNLERALAWLDANGGLRSFLFLHFDDPHEPYNQPAPYDDVFTSLGDDVGELVGRLIDDDATRSEHGRNRTRDLYDGEVAYVDDRIGVFLDALRERGLYEDTVVVFVSDHGEGLWEHGTFGHSLGRLYDEGIRVPLIVKPAGRDPARGRVARTQVRAFDVMPTLLELAGLEPPLGIDARSLVPLLSGDRSDRLAVTETLDGGVAVRNRDWKYISRSWRRPASREELFDLRVDPHERVDVSGERPEVARRMRTLALDYLLQHRPGWYLVGIGDVGAVAVVGASEAYPLHGAPPVAREDGALEFGPGAGSFPTFVAKLTAPAPVRLAGHPEPLPARRYAPGDLERLASARNDGLFLFEGPEPIPDEPRARETLDPEQIEALRELGYIGD